MLPQFRNEQYNLTPVKAQRILAQYGTNITLEDAEIMLELLRKLSKLSVNETLKHVSASQVKPREGEIVNP
ncbi:hypothetical protein DDR33_10250 [Pararcticibacter amylolyticus]|uniref:Uncharacterized protein n=1 Tax=Pararcticibacter amylolyticus TaxID=2173175 RepID=A0A2U2PHD0_9SPHI|nr:hypothetical protein DDR33_10250 [Pararcticibacter amylolyticus]